MHGGYACGRAARAHTPRSQPLRKSGTRDPPRPPLATRDHTHKHNRRECVITRAITDCGHGKARDRVSEARNRDCYKRIARARRARANATHRRRVSRGTIGVIRASEPTRICVARDTNLPTERASCSASPIPINPLPQPAANARAYQSTTCRVCGDHTSATTAPYAARARAHARATQAIARRIKESTTWQRARSTSPTRASTNHAQSTLDRDASRSVRSAPIANGRGHIEHITDNGFATMRCANGGYARGRAARARTPRSQPRREHGRCDPTRPHSDMRLQLVTVRTRTTVASASSRARERNVFIEKRAIAFATRATTTAINATHTRGALVQTQRIVEACVAA